MEQSADRGRGGVTVYCTKCKRNTIELPNGTQLAPGFAFRCRECCPAARIPVGLDAQPKKKGIRVAETGERLGAGFQLDRKTPKPIKPGPEWANSDGFLLEVTIRAKIRKGSAIMRARWREQKTFQEIAEQVGLTVEEVRKAISVLRTLGNRLWERKQRAEVKAKKIAYLSARAKALAENGHSVRQIARIMDISIGYVSELRRALELRRAA